MIVNVFTVVSTDSWLLYANIAKTTIVIFAIIVAAVVICYTNLSLNQPSLTTSILIYV